MDIDIDTQTTFDPLLIFGAVAASMVKDGVISKHPVGVYFQNIPVDPISNLAAIPYEQAEELGYFKIDMLHLSVLDHFDNKEEIRILSRTEPDWSLLKSPSVVAKLFQLSKHYDTVSRITPTSVQELADCVALIRPGKRFLLEGYLKNKELIREELYRKSDKYYFKRAHAISYATTIVLQLHLIKGGIL
jgi:DNA polymerase III alpha subunit